jgi:hypothetical protein
MLVIVMVMVPFGACERVVAAVHGAFTQVTAAPHRKSGYDSTPLRALAGGAGLLGFGYPRGGFPDRLAALALKFVERHGFLKIPESKNL